MSGNCFVAANTWVGSTTWPLSPAGIFFFLNLETQGRPPSVHMGPWAFSHGLETVAGMNWTI